MSALPPPVALLYFLSNSFFSIVSSLYWVFMPVLLMGIFALVIRIATGRLE